MKRRGSLYEQTFFTEALARNLEVFTPLGDYLPQDCLVMNQAGKIFKVQIKGTKDKVFDKANKGQGRYMPIVPSVLLIVYAICLYLAPSHYYINCAYLLRIIIF